MSAAAAALWDQLPAQIPPYGELVAHRIHADPDVFLATDHEAAPHLLLAVSDAAPGLDDDSSRGLRVNAHPLSVEGRPLAPFIDVISTDPAGREMFRLVTEEIVEAVRSGMPPPEAVPATLARWRRFWAGVPEAGLTADQVRGLFGELWFLLGWLLPRDLAHIDHWRGPEGARNDFQWTGRAVESKTTNSVRGHIHRINGIDQLVPPEGGILYVFSLRVRDEPTSNNSLVTLVERVRHELGENAALLDRLDIGLARAGYSPAHADRYRGMRFHVIDERLYRVGEGFPRLTPTSFITGVPSGVERIDYEVNLGVADALCVARSPGEMPDELRRPG